MSSGGDITQHDLTTLRRDLQIDMREANRPLERRQDDTNQQLALMNEHLRDLNGKVADHHARLAAGSQRFESMDLRIEGLVEERREYLRRSEDRERAGAERISMHDLKMFLAGAGSIIGGITIGWSLLKLLPALIRVATGQP